MEFNVTTRERKGSTQVIVSYKDRDGVWRQKSKQKKVKNEKEIDSIVYELKKIVENEYYLNKDYIDYLFEDLAKDFIKQTKKHREPDTVLNYASAITKFKTLNKKLVRDILPIDIQKCVDEMSGLAASSINAYLTVLRAVFKLSIKSYNIRYDNPVEGIVYGTYYDKDFEDDVPVRALNQSEFEKLVGKIKNPKHKLFTLLAGSCGLRAGEICGLTVNYIDFNKGLLLIRRQWKPDSHGVSKFGRLKSKNSKRDVPIPDVVGNFLEVYIKNRKIKEDDRLLNYSSTDSASAVLRSVYKSLGYHNTIHDLRHTYATTLIANRLDLKTVAYLMGHDIKETMATYSHVTDEMLAKANATIRDAYKKENFDTEFIKRRNAILEDDEKDFDV